MRKAEFAEPLTQVQPTEQLFVDRLAYALTFARNAIQHLIVEGHTAPEDAPWFVRAEKIIAETAFLIAFCRNSKVHDKINDSLSSLVEVLEPLARSKAMQLNTCLKPSLALDYAHAHICMHYAGYRDEKFDTILSASLQSSAFEGIERTPYRMMEREWLMSIWNKEYANNIRFWIPLSCLKHPVDLFSESTDGAYAITHAVMYGAFGNNTIADINLDILFDTIESLLVRYMDEQNYDIAGELLIAWPILKRKMSPIAAFALDCLFKIEARVGFLPSPGLDRTMIDDKEQKARRTYIYSINYHTALVMGLLCSSLLENAETEINTNNYPYPDKINEIIYKELHAGKEAHWREFFLELDAQQKEELTPWLYQVCLTRWIKEKKYGKVKELLELSSDEFNGLTIRRQADELIERLRLIG